ncbi:response regulator [Sulfitobacter guttiformis]|uniref:Two-component system chemotaxis response regulator CheY n=1 Tax=Sulfitobacter guttiformis TaxID=74349 RepID=A0A420DH50_9RHOB|nr:response regulator [Sulfitobacter guttiformis]KIN72749.1 Response regulator receiver-like protein [Sulfitobacter guttiformis KCTC 32187]RKE93537.1 two-component system chemotaxis response regulator CheY [Sulfitobacter guttiformis]
MGIKQSLQVMVVDDMSVSRALITNALEEIGILNYRVENDGQSALAKLVAQPCHLVISDYNMPNLDGLGLLKGLREHRITQRIGFILITGNATGDVVSIGQKYGMNNLLRKPFSSTQMKDAIQRVVGVL